MKFDLAMPSALAKGDNQPALQLDDVERWFAELRKREGMGSRALEFLALTACRSGDVRGAVWEEIDLDNALWVIPASESRWVESIACHSARTPWRF